MLDVASYLLLLIEFQPCLLLFVGLLSQTARNHSLLVLLLHAYWLDK